MKVFLSIFLFFVFLADITAQSDTSGVDTVGKREYLIQNVERDGEVLPEIAIKEVTVIGLPTRETARKSEFRKYERLVYNIRKVYPYAKLVRQKLDEVNREMENIGSEKTRREYIREFEKNIFREYEDDMRKMTITQGRLLIKLIDRETQNPAYNLIRDYRGKFSAAFWQGIARIFSTNLKEEYDPFGEDALVEIIIYEIESGRL